MLLMCANGAVGAVDAGDLPENVRSTVGPVHLSGPGEDPATLPEVEPARTDGAALVSILRTLIDAGELTEQGVAGYCAEHGVPEETLIRALDSIELSHPMKSPYLGLCESLWARLDADVDRCLELPYAPRIYMATYIAIIGRTEDARRLVLSLPDDDPMRLSADIYHIANELAIYQRTAHGLAVWIWKRGATMRGPAEQAWVCRHIVFACFEWSKRGNTDCWRDEARPWIEAALERPGAESQWGEALRALTATYAIEGEAAAGVARAIHLLDEAQRDNRPVPASQIAWAHLGVAQRIIHAQLSDRYRAAEVMLRQAIEEGQPMVSQQAQFELLRLAELHPVESPHILAPEVWAVSPDRLSLRSDATPAGSASVVVDGSATLRIEDWATDLECLSLERTNAGGSAKARNTIVYRHELQVSLDPEYTGGAKQGHLVITTNSQVLPSVTIPVLIDEDTR
ncbi:MAG: hypothetical protein ACOX9R_17315 [Armatimonadota bacterium]